MTWQHPGVLYWLLAVPFAALLPLLAWRLRQRSTDKFGDAAVLAQLTVGRSGPWRATRAVLFVLAFALTIVALAGPQFGSRTTILRRRGVDIVIALDFSKSMLAADVRPSRIERAKAEVSRLVQELEGDRVGVVAFAGEAMEFPMTTDHRALSLFFRDLGPYDMPVGGTAIGRALVSAKRLMERADAGQRAETDASARRSRVVILMTDGEDHEGDPVAVAGELAEAGIRVFTVGIGSSTPEPIPTYAPDGTWTGYLRDEETQELITTSLTEENERQLRAIADATDGRYFRAPRGQVGVEAIRAELRRMEQHENEGRRVTVHEARYALVLLPAFLFLFFEALLPDAWIGRRRKRPPPPKKRRRRRAKVVR